VIHHGVLRLILATGMTGGCAGVGFAQPVIVEDGWVFEREVDFAGAMSALINPFDGLLYTGRRSGGVYRIDAAGDAELIASTDEVAGLAIDPNTGALFVSEDFPGRIHRLAIDFSTGATTKELWVSGFQSGDDDPVGMTYVPDDYSGTLLAPGSMVSTDRGFNGQDLIWSWSPSTPEGEALVVDDAAGLVDAADIAVKGDRLFVADRTAGLRTINEDASVSGLALAGATLGDVQGVVGDSLSDDLLVLDVDTDAVYRADPDTGEASVVFSGFGLTGTNWGGLNLFDDGTTQRVVVSSSNADRITVFSITPPCSDADVAGPFGVLNFFDVSAFVGLYNAQDNAADLAAPFGVWNFFDLSAYIALYNAGCP
tara:strand:+ start:806 stop:1912 length:1107 start_codon:yes stop_codon:yes gene_type:complete